MKWNADIVLDNPILVKHVRSRLRRRLVMPAAMIVAILCLCIVWLGQSGIVSFGVPLSLMLGLQVVVLVFIGATQVGTTVNKERETGIIDFHRVSPLPPLWMAIGFLFGAPILNYVLLAITLPFAAYLTIDSSTGLLGFLQLLLSLVLLAWVIHTMVLVSSLVAKKPKSTPRGAATAIVVLALFLGQPIARGIWFATSRIQDQPTLPFYGIELHWLLFVAIYSVAIIAMLLVAATRKLRSDRMHAYSKPLAIGCCGLVAVLTLAAVWQASWKGVPLAVLYLLILVGLILTVSITPDRGEYLRGLRRARRLEQGRPSVWSDAGIIRSPLFVLCGIVFVATMIAWRHSVEDTQVAARGSLAIALGVFVVAYFGLGLQYLLLRLPKAGMGVMAVFIVMTWLVPILVGSISAGAGAVPDVYQPIMATSPVMGIAMSSGLLEIPIVESVRIAALTPAIAFAVVFNFLLVATRRKIDLAVR